MSIFELVEKKFNKNFYTFQLTIYPQLKIKSKNQKTKLKLMKLTIFSSVFVVNSKT